jgi:hypothetical protein
VRFVFKGLQSCVTSHVATGTLAKDTATLNWISAYIQLIAPSLRLMTQCVASAVVGYVTNCNALQLTCNKERKTYECTIQMKHLYKEWPNILLHRECNTVSQFRVRDYRPGTDWLLVLATTSIHHSELQFTVH